MNNYIKKFSEWIGLKEKLDQINAIPPKIHEGDVWWCSLGENIGSEISGKSNLFSRPVVVFRKLSKNTFLGIPTTSQEKEGTWFVPITYGNHSVRVILSQIRILDTRRLSNKLGQLDETDFGKIKTGFFNLFLPNMFPSCDGPWEIPKSTISISEQVNQSSQNVEIKVGQIYRHYKGKHYKVLFLTKHSETGEELAVYERQEDLKTYARPIDLFFNEVEWEDKKIVRFTLVEDVI